MHEKRLNPKHVNAAFLDAWAQTDSNAAEPPPSIHACIKNPQEQHCPHQGVPIAQLLFPPSGPACNCNAGLHRLKLSLRLTLLELNVQKTPVTYSRLLFKNADSRSTCIFDIQTILMSHTQLLQNQYFNLFTFLMNTYMLKNNNVEQKYSFTLGQEPFPALI